MNIKTLIDKLNTRHHVAGIFEDATEVLIQDDSGVWIGIEIEDVRIESFNGVGYLVLKEGKAYENIHFDRRRGITFS